MRTNDMISTRGGSHVSIDEAIKSGLAPDGGLYVPGNMPEYEINSFYCIDNPPEFAQKLLAPFFSGSRIKLDLAFCSKIFSFPLPIKQLCDKKYILELFHGPTLSFKDFGARFFAGCLEQLTEGKKTKVLVATSGDTGSAVASALHGKKNIHGIVLFPKGKISLRQQAQITCWGDNIHAIAVDGCFDDCQRMVKQAFKEGAPEGEILTTSNSINIARLLPQLLLYAYSSIQLAKQHKKPVNFIVPCGNLGNVTACYWAKKAGFPIGTILITTNANTVLTDYLATGTYTAQPSIKTLANAMDVGDPSNLERLKQLFPDFVTFKQEVNALSISDVSIKQAIKECYQRFDYLICPHTATAYSRLKETVDGPWIIVGTAHPAKFEEVIEPLLDLQIPIPDDLDKLLKQKQTYAELEPDFQDFMRMLSAI